MKPGCVSFIPPGCETEHYAFAPSCDAIRAYLSSHGWRFQFEQSGWSIYARGGGADKETLEVPQLIGAKDYAKAAQITLDELARIEGRTTWEVLADVVSIEIEDDT